MTKLIRKLRLNDYWNLVRHESWYTHMAQQGLFLKKTGAFFTYFEERPQRQMKYRIEVSKKALDIEQVDFYEAAGWDYVTRDKYFHIFSSPTELNAPEIHTDPAEQANTLKELHRLVTLNWAITIIGAIFSTTIFWAIFFLDGTPIRQLVQGMTTSQLLMPLFMFVLMLQTAQAAISIRRLKKNLQSGIALPHDIPWQKKTFRQHAWPFFYLTVLLLHLFLTIMQLATMERGTLANQQQFSVVPLAAIENNTELIRDEQFWDDMDYGNRYEKEWNPLAPTQYTVHESGLDLNMQWKGSSKDYSPSIMTEYYELSFEFLARPLASDMMEWYGYGGIDPFSEINDARFDVLYIREDDSNVEVAATKGKKAMYVRYYGYAEPSKIIEQMAKLLSK